MAENSVNDENEEENSDSEDVNWSSLLFLPFNSCFKKLVLAAVITKTVIGPIQSVYPIIYCWDTLDMPVLGVLKFFYAYCCDPIYGVDTFLHILHRQMTDAALQREFLPKSAFLLLLDIFALIPFFHLMTDELCQSALLWPNILTFNEFLIIYRIVDYFSLVTSHSYLSLIFGSTLVLGISVNCLTCFIISLTYHGLCSNCDKGIYDWRLSVLHKLYNADTSLSTYIFAASYIYTCFFGTMVDFILPNTIFGNVLLWVLLILVFITYTFVAVPKMFAEQVLHHRKRSLFLFKVCHIVDETKRRNSSSNAYIEVRNFFDLIWKRRKGITFVPEIINELPRYLRIDIKRDLVWQVFHHSPTFRRTSESFKRLLCEKIQIDYKLPGEKFYTGLNCHTHLYYLKSGIVQIKSSDDETTPLISVTSGTVFGDISFFLPPCKINVNIYCLTYCEVIFIKRVDILKSIHKYPDDRQLVLERAKDRVKHAHTLYTCKESIKGLDRSEDEGIAWLKKRWWEISNTVQNWETHSTNTSEKTKCDLPPEESVYHCAKFIGQLVLCTCDQLHLRSIFAKVEFPWLLVSESLLDVIWKYLMIINILLVLIIYPMNLIKFQVPGYFYYFEIWIELIYVIDICINIVTVNIRHEENIYDFAAVVFSHCKTKKFALDILSTIWIEKIFYAFGFKYHYNFYKFNRLIKIYILFTDWNISKDPALITLRKIALTILSVIYISTFIIYYIVRENLNDLSSFYFFGDSICTDDECNINNVETTQLLMALITKFIFEQFMPFTLYDNIFGIIISYCIFMLYLYCITNLLASFYFEYREIFKYQYFVANTKDHYKHHKIHPDLLKRLDRYLICHWKFYKGIDVMYPNMFRNEPHDIYWKVQGEVAENIIKKSKLFLFADPAMIRELAYKAKFLIFPKKSTVLLFGVPLKSVTWLVNGYILCEYPDANGEVLKKEYKPGDLLSTLSVLFGRVSLRTLTAATDCEILYIDINDFFKIIKCHPNEWDIFEKLIKEFKPALEKILQEVVQLNENYQKNIRLRIFHGEQIMHTKGSAEKSFKFWIRPDSKFVQWWLPFRALMVVIEIISASFQGSHGAMYRPIFMNIDIVCNIITVIDIVVKIMIAHYDERGLLITNTFKRLKHYFSRGFVLDVVGCLPTAIFIQRIMTKPLKENEALVINTMNKFAHLHILMGYFNYLADQPTVHFALIMILKWQLLSLLVVFAATLYVVTRCYEIQWDANGYILNITKFNKCWIAEDYFGNEPLNEKISLIAAHSFNMVQTGFLRHRIEEEMSKKFTDLGVLMFVIGSFFWFVKCYCLTLLMLKSYQGNTVFQHGVHQLEKFLKAERINKNIIKQTVDHFRYWWLRTKGTNTQTIINERIGIVFRQDMSYYFLKKTVEPLGTLLKGGETLERELASMCTQLYFLPNQVVMREMDLCSWVYIIHRGRVIIKKGDENLALLSKGSIFGQLDGTELRPVSVTATTDEHVDLLQITITDFQAMIHDEAREIISKRCQNHGDFMAVKKFVAEDPHNTVEYILRGRKVIQIPWINVPIHATSASWYTKWLYLTWIIGPVTSAFITSWAASFPGRTHSTMLILLWIFDIVHIGHFISTFYTAKLIVSQGKCTYQTLKWRIFKTWQCYVDIVSLIVQILPFVPRLVRYDVRLLRLYLLFEFATHFCRRFRNKLAPVILKYMIVLLTLHLLACGWIRCACQEEVFPLEVSITAKINASFDSSEWVYPNQRSGGCVRHLSFFETGKDSDPQFIVSFLVPKTWAADYIVAMTYIISIFSSTISNTVGVLNTKQIYFDIFADNIICILRMWLSSVALSMFFTKFRELYTYDYNIMNVIQYLEGSGLSPSLLKSVREYTTQLWNRQRGNWLPELVQQAPQCLREDLFSALYMHHLEISPLFKILPLYFKRQLVARLHRTVVFPGKFIVKEGDIFGTMYFINEGEVEKLYIANEREMKIHCVLSTNGYFGLLPGIFPNTPFQFSYYTRTVVDLVYLRLRDWQDLLDGYPDIKQILYEEVGKYKRANKL